VPGTDMDNPSVGPNQGEKWIRAWIARAEGTGRPLDPIKIVGDLRQSRTKFVRTLCDAGQVPDGADAGGRPVDLADLVTRDARQLSAKA